jgi:hypothetical protein
VDRRWLAARWQRERFGLEGITSADQRNAVMGRTMDDVLKR